MTVDVLTQIVIDRPLDRVASYAADPSNAPDRYVNIKSVEWKTQPPLAVGSRVAFVAHFVLSKGVRSPGTECVALTRRCLRAIFGGSRVR